MISMHLYKFVKAEVNCGHIMSAMRKELKAKSTSGVWLMKDVEVEQTGCDSCNELYDILHVLYRKLIILQFWLFPKKLCPYLFVLRTEQLAVMDITWMSANAKH